MSGLSIMVTAPVGCELIDLTMSSPESSDVDSDAGSESDESVIVTEVIRYAVNDKTMLVRLLLSSCVCRLDGPKMKSESSSDIDLGVR